MPKISLVVRRIYVLLTASCVITGCAATQGKAGLAAQQWQKPTTFGAEAVTLVGRHTAQAAKDGQPATIRFGHSGTTLTTRFTGDQVAVWLADANEAADGAPGSSYDVMLDGKSLAPLVLQPLAGPWYVLAHGLVHKEHSLRLVRRQEAQQGDSLLGGVQVAPGARAWAPEAAQRHLWAVGDSITAGYGNLCKQATSPFSFYTEDAAHSYVVLAADALGADAEIVASSGRGLWRNGDGSYTQTVPQIFATVLPTSSVAYSGVGHNKPDAIIVNLGTNDLRQPLSEPDKTAFVGTYVAFLARLHHLAPKALLVPTFGPMFTDEQGPQHQAALSLARSLVRRIVAESTKAHLGPVVPLELSAQDGSHGFGCQYHPNVVTQQLMAQQLEALLSHELGWESVQAP